MVSASIVWGAVATLAALALQHRSQQQVPFVPRGDESEYLKRGTSSDPFAPSPFLRPPLLIALARIFHSNARHIVRSLGLLSALAAGMTVAAAVAVFGTVALIPMAAWIALPERSIMGQRLWPEPLLSFCAAGVALLLLTTPEQAPLLLGMTCALATLTRIDGAIWFLPSAVALHQIEPVQFLDLVLVAGPTGLALTALTCWNTLRYGIPLPDTTLFFNLLVMSNDKHRGEPINALVLRSFEQWNSLTSWRHKMGSATRAQLRLFTAPHIVLFSFLRRLIGLLGKETFVTEIVLPSRGATDSPSVELPAAQRFVLRYGATGLFGCALGCVLYLLAEGEGTIAGLPWFLFPSCVMLVVASAAHTRTRYRQPLLPAAALMVALALAQPTISSLVLAAICAASTAFLLFASLLINRTERAEQLPLGRTRPRTR